MKQRRLSAFCKTSDQTKFQRKPGKYKQTWDPQRKLMST